MDIDKVLTGYIEARDDSDLTDAIKERFSCRQAGEEKATP